MISRQGVANLEEIADFFLEKVLTLDDFVTSINEVSNMDQESSYGRVLIGLLN